VGDPSLRKATLAPNFGAETVSHPVDFHHGRR
jgi:hypothetical protein